MASIDNGPFLVSALILLCVGICGLVIFGIYLAMPSTTIDDAKSRNSIITSGSNALKDKGYIVIEILKDERSFYGCRFGTDGSVTHTRVGKYKVCKGNDTTTAYVCLYEGPIRFFKKYTIHIK
jgi:hypothetical protein